MEQHINFFLLHAPWYVLHEYYMDPIADMIIQIKNAQAVEKHSAVISYSTIKNEIARVLKETGFIEDAVRRGRRNRRMLDIVLAYDKDGRSRMHGFRRVSKQSQRIYKRARDIHNSRKGPDGTFILSTPRGIMSSASARKAHIGGEVLCEVW